VVCVLLFFSFIGLSLPVVSGASICSFLIHRSFVGVDDDRFRDISRHLFNKTKFQKFRNGALLYFNFGASSSLQSISLALSRVAPRHDATQRNALSSNGNGSHLLTSHSSSLLY
jgi:hypothetical protein